MMLTIIDVMSRFTLGFLLQYSVKKEDVKELFDDVFHRFNIPRHVTVRSDNGSQFESQLVRDYFAGLAIVQEFTRPATPDMNANIEGFHSVVQRAVCDRITFENLEQAQEVMERFHLFYNFERLHSGIAYMTPAEKLRSMHVDIPQPASTQPPMPACFETQLQEYLS